LVSLTAEDLAAAIEYFLATPPYYPCLLLVHHEIKRLQTARQQMSSQYGWPDFSVGTLLSQPLLSATPRYRPGLARRTFMDLAQTYRPGPVLCADIDLLFEPTLSLDPLRLLRETSRQVSLVVLWPGTFKNSVLAYATTDHAHYRTWPQTDLCVYCIIAL
jgi:hypothetical protein